LLPLATKLEKECLGFQLYGIKVQHSEGRSY
jgi:hypothetical protein